MDTLPWFTALPASQRADVGLVVQAGIGAFTVWLKDVDSAPAPAPDVFGAAPRELTRSVNLKQTVQLIRVVVGVLEDQVPSLAEPGHEQDLLEAVLRYSREIAFAAAEAIVVVAEAVMSWWWLRRSLGPGPPGGQSLDLFLGISFAANLLSVAAGFVLQIA